MIHELIFIFSQKPGWMGYSLFQQRVDQTLRPFVEMPSGPKMMIMDNLHVQMTPESGKALRSLLVLPLNCNDLIQPVDQNFVVQIKKEMGVCLLENLHTDEAFREEWLERYPGWKREFSIQHWEKHMKLFVRDVTF